MKIHWTGIAAAATGALGVALSPAVFNVLPPKAAAIVSAAGVIYAAFTKPAVAPTAKPPAE